MNNQQLMEFLKDLKREIEEEGNVATMEEAIELFEKKIEAINYSNSIAKNIN